MIYNPGKLQSAADAISRCKPLHMLSVSVGQTMVTDKDDDVKQVLLGRVLLMTTIR